MTWRVEATDPKVVTTRKSSTRACKDRLSKDPLLRASPCLVTSNSKVVEVAFLEDLLTLA